MNAFGAIVCIGMAVIFLLAMYRVISDVYDENYGEAGPKLYMLGILYFFCMTVCAFGAGLSIFG
jgi:hypothetical protein